MIEDFEMRLDRIREKIAEACARSGRADDVSILAVTKKQEPERIDVLAGLGLTLMGESRIQEAKAKIPLCSGTIDWHFIGHLQSNKVKNAVNMFSMIHSVDSFKLLECVNAECALLGKVMPVCLEVNISGEGSKYGFRHQDVEGVLAKSNQLMNVNIDGLMTIPPAASDPEAARPFFRKLRVLRDRCREKSDCELPVLSMGMSSDFHIAVEEGATIVRLGAALFGGRS